MKPDKLEQDQEREEELALEELEEVVGGRIPPPGAGVKDRRYEQDRPT